MRRILLILAIFSTVALGVTVKNNISLNAFNAGELSPLINSRSDIAQYKVGAKTLTNMIVRSQGPIQRRPGTQYIATAKYNTNTRLVTFDYSTELSYIIEVGHQYMRFYHTVSGVSGQIVDVNDDPIEISTVYDGNDVFELQFAQDEQYVRIAHPDYTPYKLTRTADDTWTCTAITFENGPFLKENKDTTSTVYADANSGDISIVATGGIFDSNHVGSLWQIAQNGESNHLGGYFSANGFTEYYYDYLNTGAGNVATPNTPTLTIYDGQEYDLTTSGQWYGTLTIQRSVDDGTTWKDVYSYTSHASGNVQYTGEETEQASLYRLYYEIAEGKAQVCNVNFIGRVFENHGIVEITAVSDANNASATVDSKHPLVDANTPTYMWSEGAWSTYRGFPRTITHHEQRCVYGGSDSYPETIWASIIMEENEDYDNFDAGDSDNDRDAWIYKLPGNNPIQWMVSREYLMIGTTRGVGRFGQPDKPITTTFDPTYRMQAINGCAYIKAIPASDTILFVELGGKKVREVTYTYTSERYIAPDLTILAEHITGDGITSIAYAERPDPVLWCTRSDGALLSLTYNNHYGVTSWAKHTTSTDDFESVATMSGTNQDEVWAAVDRNVDSNDLIYIEKFADYDFSSQSAMWFVDSGGSDPNDLSHLEGETVSLLGDGAYIGDFTVSSGAIDSNSYTNYVVGLPFTSILETMPLVSYDRDYQASSSYLSSVQNLVLDLYETMTFDIGTDSTHVSEQDITTLYTGVRPTEFPRGQFREPTMYITVDEPSAFTLRGITATLLTDYIE